jgi:uncharacterized protein YabE (DUF348 family)
MNFLYVAVLERTCNNVQIQHEGTEMNNLTFFSMVVKACGQIHFIGSEICCEIRKNLQSAV